MARFDASVRRNVHGNVGRNVHGRIVPRFQARFDRDIRGAIVRSIGGIEGGVLRRVRRCIVSRI
jgi:hypothetical protein